MIATHRQAVFSIFLLLILAVSLLSACGNDNTTDTDGDNETTDGDTTDGDTTDGDDTDGDDTDGDDTDGDDTDGDNIDGDTTDGDTIDGDTTDGDEESAPETGATPLARKVTKLVNVDEPAYFIPGVNSDKLGFINDDEGADEPGAEIGQITDLLMTDKENGRLVTVEYGDIDSDGKDEMAVMSIYTDDTIDNSKYRFDYIHITLLDDKDAQFAVIGTIDKSAFAKNPLNPEYDSFLMGDLAIGNLDDDDEAEFVITGTYGRIAKEGSGETTYQYGSVIYTFDDLQNNLSNLTIKTDTGSGTKNMHVATGDLDGDKRDEIIVTGVDGNWPKAWALDDHTQGYEQLYRWHDLDNNVFEEYIRNPNVACGDFDGDGLDEIVFGATENSGCKVQTRVYDDKINEFKYMEGKYLEGCPNRTWNKTVPPELAVTDIDANGKDDVIVAMNDDYYQDRGWAIYYFRPDVDDSGLVTNDALGKPWEMPDYDYNFQRKPGGFHLAVGNLDRDMQGDVFAIYHNYEKVTTGYYPNEEEKTMIKGFQARRWTFDLANFQQKNEWDWDFPEPLEYGDKIQPLLCMADFDGDSVTVKYTGEHWMAMSEPRIIVAMAMPPGWGDIPQANETNTWVGYGQVRDQSTSNSNEISVSASVTMSVEGGDPFGIVEAKAGVKLEQELTKTNTTTTTVSTGIKRIGSWAPNDLDNFVIYSATEYHRYKYEVIAHLDPSKIGSFVTIDVPKETNTYKKTVTAFNEQNGDYRDIGEETFSHTIGDPSTYPTKEQRDALLDTENAGYAGWTTPDKSDPLHTVGETSGGGTEVFIEISEENSTAESRKIGVEVSAGFSVGGVGVETTAGISSNNIYEISVGESTEYVGSIGDIPSSHYADNAYTFGMFVYNFERDDGVKYQVINWCTKQ